MKEVKQCGDGGSDGPDNSNGYLEHSADSRFMEMEGNERGNQRQRRTVPQQQTRTCIILIRLFS